MEVTKQFPLPGLLALAYSLKRALSPVIRKCELKTGEPYLVAVSKTKSKEAIIEAYKCGQLAFGENYVQELVDKATAPEILANCPNIRWHFIGHLQSNKVNKLIGIPNLWVVETVHSSKLASTLNQAWKETERRLKVMVQVNTSAEESKSGVDQSSVPEIVKHILDNCPKLELVGLMNIGISASKEDFQMMQNCRKQTLELFPQTRALQLSMGMSEDFEQAIEMGSTCVRIGTAIFGARQYPVS